MASCTALGEPGSTKIALPEAVPAVARLIIAAGADLLEAEHAEQLAEPVEPLFEERVDRFEGAVARGDAGSARRDDDLRPRVGQLLAHRER